MTADSFEQLDFEQQIEMVREKPFAEKGELILKSHHPEQLVPSLPPEELYLVYRSTHGELVSDLISYASTTQLIFISDLECWRGDEIHPKKFLQWLRYLYDAGLEKLMQWIEHTDFEMVVAAFQPHLGVLKLAPPEEEIDEILGDRPYFTIDGYYYCLVKEEELELLKRTLELLFSEDKAFYIQLMEGLISELKTEIEFEALRLRQERLAEEGFPEREEAYRIYRPLTKEEWSRLPKGKFDSGRVKSAAMLTNFPTLWSTERLFFDDVFRKVLSHATPERRDYLQLELVSLSNKAIVCDGMEFSNEHRIHESVQRVRRYLSIALEELGDQNLERAVELVENQWLEHLFRWGNSRILSLRERGEGIVEEFWKGRVRQLYPLMGVPYSEILEGVLKTHPQFYDPKITDQLSPLRDFRTLKEVSETRHHLEEIRGFFIWFAHRFPDWMNELPRLYREIVDGIQIDAAALLGTCLAHLAISGSWRWSPLSLVELQEFLKEGFQGERPKRKLKRSLKERFRLQSTGENGIFLPEGFCQLVFSESELGLGNLSPDEFDPRFISGVLVKKGGTSHATMDSSRKHHGARS